MNTSIMDVNTTTPHITVKNCKAITTSQDVSLFFTKRHDDVLKKIRNLECTQEFNARNFAVVDYIDVKGEKRPMYEMTKDGFIFLVMGFTGKKAAQFKEAYINAFNEMEAKLRNASLGAKSTTQQRTPLRDAVNLLVSKKGLMYPEAYSIVHQRFNVAHIDEISDEQLPVAVEYIHKLALEGEYIPHKKEVVANTADSEHDLNAMLWVWTASIQMIQAIEAIEPLLRVANHARKAEYFSITVEHPRVLKRAREVLQRKLAHKKEWADSGARSDHPFQLLFNGCIPLLDKF